MDPLDSMTAADWRRVYEKQLARIAGLQDDLIAAQRREAELVDRLRRRDEETQRMRDDLASRIVKEERSVQRKILKDPTNPSFAGLLVGLQRARDIVTSRAREIAKEAL